ncbi:MAG: zinc-dependent alcohol dehydrogenase family protein [Armatimonadota bacterium]
MQAMNAMVLTAQQPMEANSLQQMRMPVPKPGPGQVRIRVRACGICHTDLHIVEGELHAPKLPLVPGHQVVGEVDAVGPHVSGIRIGDRVGVAWLHRTCGQCEFCTSGRENLCPSAQFTGLHVDGGYAELMLAFADFCVSIPELYPDANAAPLLCAGIIGYRALRLSDIRPGQALGLYGFGASAHIALQIARHWGCRCYVFTRSPNHQALAEELGAVWVGRAEQDPPERLHSSIVFAPAGALVPTALEHLRRGGTLALASIYTDPIPGLDYQRHLYYERTVRSVTAATRTDAADLMALAARVRIKTEVQTFPLANANEALARLKHSGLRAAGVLLP